MPTRVETIIDGSVDPGIIAQAIQTYIEGLQGMAFPPELGGTLDIAQGLDQLQAGFTSRTEQIALLTKEIILQINTRALQLNNPVYKNLQIKDKSLWSKTGDGTVLFGVLVCVDKGISGEAMGIDISNVGRVLAGDIEFAYIPSKKSFYPMASALIKRLIHYGRQGKRTLVEPLIEHTACGRRGQILANEEARGEIPTLGYIFANIQALETEFAPSPTKEDDLQKITHIWKSWPRQGVSVITPDKGLYAGVIQKIAQRQALSQLKKDITIISPIEIYEKETGNLYVGLDKLNVLTDPRVQKAGGFPKEVLTSLTHDQTIFSLSFYADRVFTDIETRIELRRGSCTYHDLQKHWLESLAQLVSVTEVLWRLYEAKAPSVQNMISAYFKAFNGSSVRTDNPVDRRIIHHVFHVVAYTFLLDTLTKGHEPGVKHIEHYLATGDHEIGSKPLIALGQGDLDRPSASEMFTGYSVLLHSSPGHDGTPIPVVIKMDTDRPGNKPMSTEETNIAFDDMREFLKLWPYFLVGDMIPILMVRGKHTGGVSRLGLSIIRSLGDMCTLLEQSDTLLPQFVPANNSRGAVVLVPSRSVIEVGIQAGNDLKKFRSLLPILADAHSDKSIQRAYRIAHGIL
jgi:hypothetical protein